MIAPRHLVRHHDREFAVVQRGEAWVMEIEGAEYFLTSAETFTRHANQFLRERLRNVRGAELRRPSLIASPRFPLLITVDRVPVRAWPAFVPRDHGAKTYVNQGTGERVAATKGPVWMFAAAKRKASVGGTTNYQQTIDDVADMAKIWLRSDPSTEGTAMTTEKGTINGVAVYGVMQLMRGERTSYRGMLKVGDNDGPALVKMMTDMATSETPIIYEGPVRGDSQRQRVRIPVLINVRMGTAATVVEVTSAGAPIE